jgi:hypothetical protein
MVFMSLTFGLLFGGWVNDIRGNLEKARQAWGKSKNLFLEVGAKPMVEKVQGWIDGL